MVAGIFDLEFYIVYTVYLKRFRFKWSPAVSISKHNFSSIRNHCYIGRLFIEPHIDTDAVDSDEILDLRSTDFAFVTGEINKMDKTFAAALIEKNLPETIMVDCSHGNSMKKYQGQAVVWKNVIGQYLAGNESLIGLMLESNLHAGNQAFSGDASMLKYGLSITDECISWDTTQQLLLWADEKLRQTGIKQ